MGDESPWFGTLGIFVYRKDWRIKCLAGTDDSANTRQKDANVRLRAGAARTKDTGTKVKRGCTVRRISRASMWCGRGDLNSHSRKATRP